MYELIFTNEYGHDEVDYFEGSWFDLQEQIRFLRDCGCSDIVANRIDAEYT